MTGRGRDSIGKKWTPVLTLLLTLSILIMVNALGQIWYAKYDLTEEKRYTLSEGTKRAVAEIEENVYIEVLLEGTFPAGFKRLKTAVEELLGELQSINPNIRYRFTDPSAGTVEEVNQRRTQLATSGIQPVELTVQESDQRSEKLIYPYAIFNFGERQVAVNLLENERPGTPPEVVLNQSISLLEYKFANGILKLFATQKPTIVFTEGHGELEPAYTEDFEKSVKAFYNTGRINLDSIYRIDPQHIQLVIIARPQITYSQKDLFKIDQYVMYGGKVMFLVDPLAVNLDSINQTGSYVPHNYDLNLDDLLFKYGVRIEPNLIMDLESTPIPMKVGKMGSQTQNKLFKWWYHPAVFSTSDHPIVKNLDRINLKFPASIDTIETETLVEKTVLLQSSTYSRIQYAPVELTFDVLRLEEDPSLFQAGPQNVAVLLEGIFTSLYANRLSSGMAQMLREIDVLFMDKSEETKIMVVSDGDVIANLVSANTGAVAELGFNQYDRYTYANKDFLINSVEYMLDKQGVLEARSKDVVLRLLNRTKLKEEKTYWQLLNILTPLVALLLFGITFQYIRQRKYTR